MGSTRPNAAAAPFAQQIVNLLDRATCADLALVCRDTGGISLATLSDTALLELERYLPDLLHLDRSKGRVTARSNAIRMHLQSALRARASASSPMEDPVNRILAAIESGAIAEALDEFDRNGGIFFAYIHGLEAAQRLVNAFPEMIRNVSEQLILADALNAMKAGNIAHTRLLLRTHFGSQFDAIDSVSAASLSTDFACCRLVVAVCDEERISDPVLTFIFAALESLPPEAAMQRGMLYNVALDAFFRRRQWGTAEETALRAKYHFQNARAPLPAFYIDLFLALIQLARGDVGAAQARLADARDALQHSTQPTRNDEYLLRTLDYICLYELGDPQPLADFLLTEMQDDAFGEIWPSIAWPIIYYGSHAMAARVTLSAALAYVERWRVQQWRSSRFETTVALSEVDALQHHGRWHAAEEIFHHIVPAGKGPWEAGAERLCDLEDNETIEIVLKWCRFRLEASAADEALQACLESFLLNQRLMARQRMTLLLWAAAAARARNDWPRLLSACGELAEMVRGTRIVAVIAEQRHLLARILADRDAMRHLGTSPKISAFLRAHREIVDPQIETERESGLTRQEARILHLLAERASNKVIARRLGLSLATVRFHLKNLYRKLDCAKRDEAVAIAAARAIISQ